MRSGEGRYRVIGDQMHSCPQAATNVTASQVAPPTVRVTLTPMREIEWRVRVRVNPENLTSGSHPGTCMAGDPVMNLHEIEERDFGRGPVLWDADPDVCCAAYQLGACAHTEFYPEDEFDDEETR